MTSPNGRVWTQHAITNNQWQSICWSKECGKFCIVGSSNTNRTATSVKVFNLQPPKNTQSDLTVNGVLTAIASSNQLTLNQNANTHSGTLSVDTNGYLTLNSSGNQVIVDSTNVVKVNSATISNATNAGAMQVVGGVGIGGAVYIGGSISSGAITSNATLNISSAATTSTVNSSWLAPSLNNSYGVQVSMGTAISASNCAEIGFIKAATGNYARMKLHSASGALEVTSTQTKITYNTVASTTSTGALAVTGGVGIGGNLNVGGNINCFDNQIKRDAFANKTLGERAVADPNNWILGVSPPTGNTWRSVCWSPSLGIFCACALSGAGNRIMTSLDGKTWIARTTTDNANWYGICWSPELSLFCVVADTNTATTRVMTSPDGIIWSSRSHAVANSKSWNNICWSPELGIFCAVGKGGTTYVMTSVNGVAWDAQTALATTWQDVCWSPELGLFCVVGSNGTSGAMTSPNGVVWSVATGKTPSFSWLSVCWSAELRLFCAVSNNGGRAMTSPDGLNWTQQMSAATNSWHCVRWSPELGLFCATAYSGSNRVMTSPDGITWTSRTPEADISHGWYGLCWSKELGIFCAVSNDGNSMTSRPVYDKLIPKNLVVDSLYVEQTTASTSTSTGSLQVAGGAGIGKDVYIGGDVHNTFNGNDTSLSPGGNGCVGLKTVNSGFALGLVPGTTFYLAGDNSIHADYSMATGGTTCTPSGLILFIDRKLSIPVNGSISYPCDSNVDGVTTGAFRFKYTPVYSSPITSNVNILAISSGNNFNAIYITHQTDGKIWVQVRDSAGTATINTSFGAAAWSWSNGTEYEFELNWNVTSPAELRLFINGTIYGTVNTTVVSRTAAVSKITFGGTTNYTFRVRDVNMFKTVQHTANYSVPTYTYPQAPIISANDNMTIKTGRLYVNSSAFFGNATTGLGSMRWGATGAIASTGAVIVSFSPAFTTDCDSVIFVPELDNNSTSYAWTVGTKSNTGFTIRSHGGLVATNGYYIAFGY
jgi:hypothetical protein